MLDKIKNKTTPNALIVFGLLAILVAGVVNFFWTGDHRPFSGFFDYVPGAGESPPGQSVGFDPYITRNPNLSDLLTGPILNPSDPALGDKYAKVNIFIFSDFACSFCAKQEQVLKKIYEKYRGVIRLYWKDYPEADPASSSFQAAVAAQCAHLEGRFWPYHDFLYEAGGKLGEEKYFEIANLLKLDQGKFKDCLEGEEAAAAVREDIDEGDMLEISGIPFMYIGSQEVMGEASFEELERLVKLELEGK